MNYLTRYYFKISQLVNFINQKFKKLKKNILSLSFFLFAGFFLGNLFGTFVNSIRQLNVGDSFLIIIIIFLSELINFFIYKNYNTQRYIQSNQKIYSLLNAFKIGIFLGFFVDSFKVGS